MFTVHVKVIFFTISHAPCESSHNHLKDILKFKHIIRSGSFGGPTVWVNTGHPHKAEEARNLRVLDGSVMRTPDPIGHQTPSLACESIHNHKVLEIQQCFI